MITLDEMQTIRDVIRYTTSLFAQHPLFYGHGTQNAFEEACALTFSALHLSPEIQSYILDAKLSQEERKKITLLIQKRVEDRIPVPYLTQEAWFAGFSFYVDSRVLIPRSSIGELIINQFSPHLNINEEGDALDLCTGSGCIAIALALTYPELNIDASDYSEEALAVAQINRLRHQVENRVTLHHSNLFENLPKKKYDLIVSNPPYVNDEEMSHLPVEYLHEPRMALHGGTDGLDLVTTILAQSLFFLKKTGYLIMEVGNAEQLILEKYPTLTNQFIAFEESEGGVFWLSYAKLKHCLEK